VPTALYLVVVERSVDFRAVLGYVVRAAGLTLLISSATLVYFRYNVTGFTQNLTTTELPRTVSSHSSWSETWRGLGSWLTYLRIPTGLTTPQAASYFTNALVLAATFAIPVIALATLWRSRWRPRLLFAAIALVSLILMVGLYPTTNLTLVGKVLNAAYNQSVFIRSFRDSYKAGAGVGIGISVLVGVGVADLPRHLGRGPSPRKRTVGVGALLAVVLIVSIASFPFWTGRLYAPNQGVTQIPQYWQSAIAYLNREPGNDRVLILPGTTRTRYRWGYVGDDIFDALLRKPHIVNQSLPQGSPEAANLLVALDNAAISPTYQASAVSEIARRLGVQWVVVRNDVVWETTSAPRPSDLDGVRSDPGLRRVATFGRRGQHVASPGDPLVARLGETALHPVEIYEVRDAQPTVQLVARQAPLLLSGDGDAWPQLASSGLLAGTEPVEYTAALSEAALEERLRTGASLVVSDTNRRRVTQVTADRNYLSQTLSRGQDLSRPPDDLFHRAGSQSIAAFPDATRVVASTYGNTAVSPFQAWLQPANAFAADPNSAWMVSGLQSPVGAWIRVNFKRPELVGQVGLTAVATGQRHITSAVIRFSNGSHVAVGFATPRRTATFRPRKTRSLEISIRSVLGLGGAVGFSDVSVPGLDLTESIALPTDVARAAAAYPRLRQELSHAPLTYAFQRLTGRGASDIELALHRTFVTPTQGTYELTGTAQVDASTPPSVLALVRGGSLTTPSCTDELLSLDGRPVPVRVAASSEALTGGQPVTFASCGPIAESAGTHQLDSNVAVDGFIDTVDLATGSASVSPISSPLPFRLVSQSPARIHVEAVPNAGAYLIIGQSFSGAWRATAPGVSIGSAQALNTLTGWTLPRGRSIDIVATYGPQGSWDVALAITAGTVAACVWLVGAGWHRRRTRGAVG
jgi:arabinofuranan 3-O-arabinosyltransferase